MREVQAGLMRRQDEQDRLNDVFLLSMPFRLQGA
jgi:hypothetical protein